MTYKAHYPVLKKECIEFLSLDNQTNTDIYIADLTFGGGGHSWALLSHGGNIHIKACDQDIEAVNFGKKIIKQKNMDTRMDLIHQNFKNFSQYAGKHYSQILKIGFHGILLDLGVSSHQLESVERGFSFKSNGPLDMRMDRDNMDKSAEKIINEYPVEELEEIFRNFGEESNSKRIAEKIAETRKKESIKTSEQLENLIFHCYPKRYRYGRTHPATRCFQ
ncbi:MAG: 16S rRNA (cytosine(1402)-N(4))-methyltransferase RsmH, partial [Halobacteriovoraceae bacterium]|nr:16S rRNA (cytosine(1402)-N(4))-methyltransferase RsmH [Halobacteriovoraceae bacterium]